MAWYRAGTTSFTNGSPTVTGTGTEWIANATIGEGFIAPDGRVYEITDIVSNTSLTISPNYMGATASGQGYAIAPLRGRIADLMAETASLLSSFATVRDGIGSGLFPNGTVAAPALRAAADQDTGLFFPAANTVAVGTGGAERVRVTPEGRFGVGTPEPAHRMDVQQAGSATSRVRCTTAGAGLFAELLLETSNTFSATSQGFVRAISLNGGNADTALTFGTSAGSDSSATEHMRIASNGNVGIRTNSPWETLSLPFGFGIALGSSEFSFRIQRSASGELATTFSDTYDTSTARIEFTMRRGAPAQNTPLVITGGGIVRPGADNSHNLGDASFRWGTVFAGTGTINTSDEREKVWRGELTEAELRAAKRIIGELGIYQWADSFEEKGKDARLHFGVRAQRAFAILEDEGLDWWRYAWCCHDKWDEITEPVFEEVTVEKTRTVERPKEVTVEKVETVMEPVLDPETGEQVTDEETGEPVMAEVERTIEVTETVMEEVEETYEETEQRDTGEVRIVREAGDRYGIRPDQLAFWLIAAQAAIQSDLDARLTALEGKKK